LELLNKKSIEKKNDENIFIIPPSIALTVDVLPRKLIQMRIIIYKYNFILPALSRPNTPIVIFLKTKKKYDELMYLNYDKIDFYRY
jgi:hypothetical protein